jgi:mannose-6-phosphate isomerase
MNESDQSRGVFAPRRVDKPWGHELILAETGDYVGKLLHITRGKRLSLQYHEFKDETIHVHRGTMRFTVGPSVDALEDVTLNEGMSYHIPPGRIHRMEALTDVDVLEVSTPHLDDVVRLEDDHGRA